MEEIKRLAAELGEAIRNSEAYAAYKAARAAVNADEELTLKLYRYKKTNAEYRFRLMFDKLSADSLLDDEKRVAAQYHELRMNPGARAYLDNERVLLAAVEEVAGALESACDIEMII